MMSTDLQDRVLYEDNHIIIVNKLPGEIVQGDKTGDRTLMDDIKQFLKEKYGKPGNVFLGLPHRLDRPTSGAVVFAKTDKALGRLNGMFRDGGVRKTYLAVVDKPLVPESGELRHYIYRDSAKNKSFAYRPAPDGSAPSLKGIRSSDLQEARLVYSLAGQSDRYFLLEIKAFTQPGPVLPDNGRILPSRYGYPSKGWPPEGIPTPGNNRCATPHSSRGHGNGTTTRNT